MELRQSTAAFGRFDTLTGPHSFGFPTGCTVATSGRGKYFDQFKLLTTKPESVVLDARAGESSVVISSFVAGGQLVELCQPIVARCEGSEGDFEIEVQALGILEYGVTKEECQDNFLEALAFRWEEYALESDENLSPRALEIANNFRSMAKRLVCP